MSLLRRTLELGAGLVLLTKEAADDLVDQLTKSGEMEHDKARSFVDQLAERGRQMREELADNARRETEAAIQRAGLARAGEVDTLRQRVVELERRVRELEGAGYEATDEI